MKFTLADAIDMTGLNAVGLGQEVRFVNLGPAALTLKHLGSGSLPKNQFFCQYAADIVLALGDQALAVYLEDRFYVSV